MKFDNNAEKEIQQIGEIENNKIGIDTANLDFIVTILSTNLYSKPIESFIRETVSNAWDSHVEAKVSDPVVLELGEDTEGNYYCRIQDFGVGLSKERFDTIYKNIGSSTKRASNDQIGGFGIGRFAALAYSDVVHITSTFDGTKCRYLMYKDGNSISIDLIHEEFTTERNGVEVQVPIQSLSDVYSFEEAVIKQLCYFENLYVSTNIEDISLAESFNNFKIKKYDNFSLNTLVIDKNIKLILGKVVYPLRTQSLDKSYTQRIQGLPIAVNFEIGEIEVTPNREEIQYSKKNIEVIEQKLDKAIIELDTIIESKSKKDFTVLSEYVEALSDKKVVSIYENINVGIGGKNLNYTYKGNFYDYLSFKQMYREAMNCSSILKTSYEVANNKLKYKSLGQSLTNIKNRFSDFYICEVSGLNNMSKAYLREIDDKFLFSPFTDVKTIYKKYATYLKKRAKDSKNGYSYDSKEYFYDHRITKVLFNIMLKNLSLIPTFDNNSVPQSFIDDKKAEAKAKRLLRKKNETDWKQNVSLGKLRYSSRSAGSVTIDTETHSLEDLKGIRRLCVYTEKGNDAIKNLHLIENKRIDCYVIAPSRLQLLKDLPNFVKYEDFIMNINYKIIRNIATACYIQDKLPFLSDLDSIGNLDDISIKLHNLVKELSRFRHSYMTSYTGSNTEAVQELRQEIYQLAIEKNYFNEEIRAKVDENFNLLQKANCLTLFTENSRYSYSVAIPKNRINVVIDYLLARKVLRPNIPAVVRLKQETIFNIKPEENEDN